MQEVDFIAAILEKPRDDDQLLIYADWLEDQGDTDSVYKSTFLRLLVEIAGDEKASTNRRLSKSGRFRPSDFFESQPNYRQLIEIAKALPQQWLAVVSRRPVEYCRRSPLEFHDRLPVNPHCRQRWEHLVTTSKKDRRYCDGCNTPVFYCDDNHDLHAHLFAGYCVVRGFALLHRHRKDLTG